MTNFASPIFIAGSDIQTLTYTTNANNKRTQIRHRDGRIWTITITTMASPIADDRLQYDCQMWMRSDGCRDILILTGAVDDAMAIVRVFSDLRDSFYSRLVADAYGTASHPMGGVVGAFSFRTFRNDTPYGAQAATRDAAGLARIDNLSVTLFPQAAEYTYIFGTMIDTAAANAAAVIDENMNTVNSKINDPQPSFRFANGRREVVHREARLGVAPTSDRELQNTLRRLVAGRNAATAEVQLAPPPLPVGEARGRRINVPRRGQDGGN